MEDHHAPSSLARVVDELKSKLMKNTSLNAILADSSLSGASHPSDVDVTHVGFCKQDFPTVASIGSNRDYIDTLRRDCSTCNPSSISLMRKYFRLDDLSAYKTGEREITVALQSGWDYKRSDGESYNEKFQLSSDSDLGRAARTSTSYDDTQDLRNVLRDSNEKQRSSSSSQKQNNYKFTLRDCDSTGHNDVADSEILETSGKINCGKEYESSSSSEESYHRRKRSHSKDIRGKKEKGGKKKKKSKKEKKMSKRKKSKY